MKRAGEEEAPGRQQVGVVRSVALISPSELITLSGSFIQGEQPPGALNASVGVVPRMPQRIGSAVTFKKGEKNYLQNVAV